ncbi:MAG: ABC transporter permease [Calditrichaeota bacterium]|nr:ABC transporter permease [Calditrichota bacterium]MCB0304235.1 ABC transporter permease [Calditrichota bacterium]MCB9088515.1 ABC transporter permease [Calditrichia bacterium]
MIIFQLALRNLIRAGLRTWLNVFVLSLAFVAIILMQGVNQGIIEQASRSMIDSELGGGQYWHANYDPFDPLTLEDAHAPLPPELQRLIAEGKATAVLVSQGTIYPGGRMMPVLLKGIDPRQQILDLPTAELANHAGTIPVLLGSRMAESTGLKVGDPLTIRWRDAHGTFDARDALVVQIMNTSVQTVDQGQVWLPLDTLRRMAAMPGEATLITLAKNTSPPANFHDWDFKDLNFLLRDVREIVRFRKIAAGILNTILLFLALVAIFDTQILSVFRRRKEIGTLIALGMTRSGVIRLFTLEGGLHGILAVVVGAIYGIPLLGYLASTGIPLPQSSEGFGMAIGLVLYPVYGPALVLGSLLLVLLTVTVVSYLPTRQIANLKPTEALRGRVL